MLCVVVDISEVGKLLGSGLEATQASGGLCAGLSAPSAAQFILRYFPGPIEGTSLTNLTKVYNFAGAGYISSTFILFTGFYSSSSPTSMAAASVSSSFIASSVLSSTRLHLSRYSNASF